MGFTSSARSSLIACLFVAALLAVALRTRRASSRPTEDVIVVLHNGRQGPRFTRSCDRCVEMDIRDVTPLRGRRIGMIVVSGQSLPPRDVLGVSLDDFARAIRTLDPHPPRLVLDTCYGASADVVAALTRGGVHAEAIVGVASKVPLAGLSYPEGFGTELDDERALGGISCARCATPITVLRGDYEPRIAVLQREVTEDVRLCRRRPVRNDPDLYSVYSNRPEVLGMVLVTVPGGCLACVP
jgi:hypothetical protein